MNSLSNELHGDLVGKRGFELKLVEREGQIDRYALEYAVDRIGCETHRRWQVITEMSREEVLELRNAIDKQLDRAFLDAWMNDTDRLIAKWD